MSRAMCIVVIMICVVINIPGIIKDPTHPLPWMGGIFCFGLALSLMLDRR